MSADDILSIVHQLKTVELNQVDKILRGLSAEDTADVVKELLLNAAMLEGRISWMRKRG